MYADKMTSRCQAIDETYRRRRIPIAYNEEHGITPQGIRKAIRDITDHVKKVAEERAPYMTGEIPRDELARLIRDLEGQMKQAAKALEFEKAALLRDQIVELRKQLVSEPGALHEFAVAAGRPGPLFADPGARARPGRARRPYRR
jgi:excinuclease ABC subunit B